MLWIASHIAGKGMRLVFSPLSHCPPPPHTRPSTSIVPSPTGGAFALLFRQWLVVISGRQPTLPPPSPSTTAIKARIGSVRRYFLTPKTRVSRHCSGPFETVLSRLCVSPPTIIIIMYGTFCFRWVPTEVVALTKYPSK